MNNQNLTEQAQKKQAGMQKKAEELNKKESMITSENNLGELQMLGNLEIKAIKIFEASII